MSEQEEDEGTSDATFRKRLDENGYKPDADGMRFGPAQPKILVAGAYKVIRTAAAKAREVMGREKG